MAEEEEDQDKEVESLKTHAYFHEIGKNFQELALIFDDFEDSQQPSELDQLVKPSNPGYPDQPIEA